MKKPVKYVGVALGACAFVVMSATGASAGGGGGGHDPVHPGHGQSQVTFATFNTSMNFDTVDGAGKLVASLSTTTNERANRVAQVVQTIRPDVILLQEFDYDTLGSKPNSSKAAELLQKNYLSRAHNGHQAITYPYAYTAPVNTGVQSGVDLDHSGVAGDSGNDAFGFGNHPGVYGMLVLSKYPIDTRSVRTFQKFLWKDLPGVLWPKCATTAVPPEDDPYGDNTWCNTHLGQDFYSPEAKAVLRLASKSHWDVPITVGHDQIHLLASHPTPPTFDGLDDHNGIRNHDEIAFWAKYVDPAKSSFAYDDKGRRGGLRADASFVIAGDQNADPVDGDSYEDAIQQLLTSRYIRDPKPSSKGAVEDARIENAQEPDSNKGNPKYDTGDFGTPPGNLRIDYVLPSKNLKVRSAGVFWPTLGDPDSWLYAPYTDPATGKQVVLSDHHPVWLTVNPGKCGH